MECMRECDVCMYVCMYVYAALLEVACIGQQSVVRIGEREGGKRGGRGGGVRICRD